MAGQTPDPLEKARSAKAEAARVFSALLGGEVAVGITRIGGVYGLKVNLVTEPSASVDLPAAVEGVPVRVEVTGPVKKRPGLAR
jgi:hypothetical protein